MYRNRMKFESLHALKTTRNTYTDSVNKNIYLEYNYLLFRDSGAMTAHSEMSLYINIPMAIDDDNNDDDDDDDDDDDNNHICNYFYTKK